MWITWYSYGGVMCEILFITISFLQQNSIKVVKYKYYSAYGVFPSENTIFCDISKKNWIDKDIFVNPGEKVFGDNET